METEKKAVETTVTQVPRKKKRFKEFRDNFELSLLAFPAVALLFIFAYIPMFGVVIAFKNYKAARGIFGSDWVGLDNFKFFFQSETAWRITRNTVGLNILFIATSTIVSVAIALMLYEVTSRAAVKVYQTTMIFPNFLSWVVVGYMFFAFFNQQYGMINQWITALGGTPVSWYTDAGKWPAILTLANIWKGAGYNAIIYYAALMGIDSSYFEAAAIDGANKLQTVRKISLPFLIPTVVILTILAVGRIFRADFGMFFYLTKDQQMLYPTTDVIDTYLYRALKSSPNQSRTAAVGLYQSVVGLVLVVVTNAIVKRIDPESALY